MKKSTTFALMATSITMLVTGCATMPTAEYVAPSIYQNYDCPSLTNEYNRVTQYINANQRQSGLTMSGVGIGIGVGRGGVYPSINLGIGQSTGGNRSNLAMAMGQRDAMILAARGKQCAFATGQKLSSEK